nr:MAG TPA: helix-turn-helix domain protein [Caudoviricetes sp.]
MGYIFDAKRYNCSTSTFRIWVGLFGRLVEVLSKR